MERTDHQISVRVTPAFISRYTLAASLFSFSSASQGGWPARRSPPRFADKTLSQYLAAEGGSLGGMLSSCHIWHGRGEAGAAGKRAHAFPSAPSRDSSAFLPPSQDYTSVNTTTRAHGHRPGCSERGEPSPEPPARPRCAPCSGARGEPGRPGTAPARGKCIFIKC